MDTRKAIIGAILLLVALWWLYPPRQLAPPRNYGSADVVEITYMGPAGPLAGAMDDVIRAFESQSEAAHAKDPSKPIYHVVSGQNAASDQVSDPTRFLVSVAGKSPPDVIEFDRYAIAEWAARGGFASLDTFIDQDKAAGITDSPRRDQFFPAAWDEATYKGRVFGIPKGIDDRALVWNGDALRKAGLVDANGKPTPPKTWSELRTAMRKMTVIKRRSDGQEQTLEKYFESLPADAPRVLDPSQYALVDVGFIPMYGDSWLYMYGWMNGGEFMSADGQRVTLDDPKIVEALTFMKSLYDELGGYATVKSFEAGFQNGGALDPFIGGTVAMKIGGAWDLLVYGQYAKMLDIGVSTPPVSDARYQAGLAAGSAPGFDKISWTGGFAYAIPSDARHKQAAWELIRYLSSDHTIQQMAEAERQVYEAQGQMYVPKQSPKMAMNDWLFDTYLKNNPNMPAKYVQAAQVHNDLLKYSRFRPITPVGQLLWNYHVSSTEEALLGSKTPQQALHDANEKVQQQLDLFYKPVPGVEVRSWTWFFWLYGGIVVVTILIAIWWDAYRRNAPVVSFTKSQWFGGYVCASPWLIGFLIFGGGPMLFSLIISFCRWDILNVPVFTGFDNYRRMFTQDEKVWKSLGNTMVMLLSVPLGMAISLVIALLLNQGTRLLSAWRTIFYLPSIMPLTASALIFFVILNPQAGLLSKIIQPTLDFVAHLLHHPTWQAPQWLQDVEWAKPGLILMGLWGAGGGMILWLAGLKGIPQSLYEAAAVDGATIFQQFRTITIPQLTPYIFFNLVIGLIGTLQVFGQAFIMTHGGPADATLFYSYHLFNNAFRYGQMGYASAMAWLLFAIALLLTVIQMRLSRRWVHYDNS